MESVGLYQSTHYKLHQRLCTIAKEKKYLHNSQSLSQPWRVAFMLKKFQKRESLRGILLARDCWGTTCNNCQFKIDKNDHLKSHMKSIHDQSRESFGIRKQNFDWKAVNKYLIEKHIRSVHILLARDCHEVN